MKKISILIAIAMGSTNALANLSNTAVVDTVATNDTQSVQKEKHATQSQDPEDIAIQRIQHRIAKECVIDSLGYTLNPKGCVDAQIKFYVAQVKKKERAKAAKLGAAYKKSFVHSGTAKVSVDKTDLKWGDHRIAAFDDAIQVARVNFITEINADLSSSTLKGTSFDNGIEKNVSFTDSEKRAFLNREVNLDITAGVADAVIESETGKEVNLSDSIELQPMTKTVKGNESTVVTTKSVDAAAEISGSYVVRSFEAVSGEGVTWVGVVIRGSEKSKRQIRSIYEGGSSYQPVPEKVGKGIDPYIWFNKEYNNLYKEVGTKLMWNERGYPVLLSFGQTSNPYVQGTFDYDMYETDFAADEALTRALGGLSEVFNLQGVSNKKSAIGKTTRKEFTVTFDGQNEKIKTKEITDLVKKVKSFSEMNSSTKGMQGLKEIGTYDNYHPVTNKKITGVVYVWSPEYAAASQSYSAQQGADTSKGIGGYNGGGSIAGQEQATTPGVFYSETQPTQQSLIMSQDLMDDSDF
ncbi:hypothetical protein L4C39_09270 [Vibrio clamense]|uniref:hypothetical protein n=1 Tax=Vibrio clamense TaxID=2910254 RepID=UPI003D1A4AD0